MEIRGRKIGIEQLLEGRYEVAGRVFKVRAEA